MNIIKIIDFKLPGRVSFQINNTLQIIYTSFEEFHNIFLL